jgi:hypothetical protein
MVLDRRCDERVGIVGTIPRSSSASAINAMILRRLIIEADRLSPTVAIPPILLQKSKVAGRLIFREITKREAIADSYGFTHISEVACSLT